jgi:hypothetical protein
MECAQFIQDMNIKTIKIGIRETEYFFAANQEIR